MSRAAPAMPISPKLFRHFAGVTVAITICVAVFADGERREVVNNELEAIEARNSLRAAEAAKMGARHVGLKNLKVRDEKRSYMAFAPDGPSEAEGSFGAPMDSALGEGGRRSNGASQPHIKGAGGMNVDSLDFGQPGPKGAPLIMPGVPKSVIEHRQRRRPYKTMVTDQERAIIEAASRARSGKATPASD